MGGFPAGFAVQIQSIIRASSFSRPGRGLTAPMQAVESSQSMLAETLPPQTHRIDTAPLARADRPQRKPTAEIENDARPAAVFTASTATVGASS
jgi:hypothetical protein